MLIYFFIAGPFSSILKEEGSSSLTAGLPLPKHTIYR